MNNVIVLYKDEDGDVCCHEITKKGASAAALEDEGYWKEGETILLDEIEEILNREVFVDKQQNKKE